MKKNKSRFLILTLFIALLLSVGCASDKRTETIPGSASTKMQLNASFASRPLNVPAIVALEQKNFENEFQKNGVQFNWQEIVAGPMQLEALASKSIDISTSMNYVSALLGKANGNDLKVVAGYSRFPRGIGIVARVDSNLKTIADLKSKKIALQKGTMLHEFLIKVLENQNMKGSDVEIIAMESTDAATALLGGQIDAAILPEPLLGKVLSTKKASLLQTAEGNISAQTFIVARTEYAKLHPETVKRFVELHNQNISWAEVNKNAFFAIASKQLNLEEKAIGGLYPKFEFKTKLTQANIDELKLSAQFLQRNGFIKSSVDTDKLVLDLVDLSYSDR